MPTLLTPRQQQIFELIVKSPNRLTIREICDKVAASNPISIQRDLAALCGSGFITSDRRARRRPR